MKKFFDFNSTINGSSFFLRNLFVIVFLFPFFILTLFFFWVIGMEILDGAGIDIQEIQSQMETGTLDQQEFNAQLEEAFKDNPE